MRRANTSEDIYDSIALSASLGDLETPMQFIGKWTFVSPAGVEQE